MKHPHYEPFEKAQGFDEAMVKSRAAKTDPEPLAPDSKIMVVIGKHRYYNLFSAQLVEGQLSKNGELRMPLTILNPIDLIWNTNSPEELKFYTAILKFQAFYEKGITDTEGLKALISNPFKYAFYLHDNTITEKITPRSITPVTLSQPGINFKVQIGLGAAEVYHIQGSIRIHNTYIPLNRVAIRFDYFLALEHNWYLCEDLNVLQSIAYFKKHDNDIKLPYDDFLKFQREVLSEMEKHVEVEHAYLKPATPKQLRYGGFDQGPEQVIYLSGLGDFIILEPVMRYGEVEIPVLSRKQIYEVDNAGDLFGVKRNVSEEDAFTATLVKQHPHFLEQMENPLPYFYLHKSRFLDESWFLDAFEAWSEQGISVSGFNEIKDNKLNPHKAGISIHVASGLNWFNATLAVKFGRKTASLKQLHKSVKNKNKYVTLDDGTLGILPEEWLHKFERYFSAGEVEEETLRIPKINYQAITELYEAQMLDQEVLEEVNHYRTRLSDFNAIKPVPVPDGLQATLRTYQRQGVSWLNFLDDFNFGGCLADDMGLGKSVQIIAFMLLLRKKSEKNTNLLVVPTSLLHNWEEEIRKFAPSLKVLVLHGADRVKNTRSFEAYEVIMTTYGTLVSDITFLNGFVFNYIFLDESQNIKNITSQRYKAARLLKSRNKVVISGTPVENNTFDLYAQLSFACPGLLGTRQFFRNTYAIPIDKFKNKRSAQALQEKISPFILRRTKKEVAKELPEKTEVVLYCEMGVEQRKLYDATEKEFREYITASGEEVILKNGMHVLRGITKLRQICNSPLLIGDEKLNGDTSSKIEMLLEQVKSISREHKVLVFSQFVAMLDLIGKEFDKAGIKHTSLTGSTRNRGAVIKQFQEDEQTRVFLISLKAGGTGLNLTAADYVFVVDPWWNPAVENQAIDRSYRIGQEKHVIAARLICPDTVEEKIMLLQQNKAKLATDLISTDDSFFKSLTRSDLLSLMNPGQV